MNTFDPFFSLTQGFGPQVAGFDLGSDDYTAFARMPAPEAPSLSAPRIVFAFEAPTETREMFVRKTITQFAVMDDEGNCVDFYDTYDDAALALDEGEQVVELTGTGFVRA